MTSPASTFSASLCADGRRAETDRWLDRHAAAVALALAGANLLLKIPLIDRQGLWFDEAVSLEHVQGSFDFARTLATDASAPLHNLLLYGWSRLFGPSLEAARSLSILLSSGTAVALFLFGRRFLDARAGFFAAALYTLSRTQTYYGHEARAYALVGLLCVASFYAFLALLEEPTRRRIAVSALLSAALVYAHYVAVFALCAQLIAALILAPPASRALRAYVVSQALAALLFAPCLAHLLLADDPLPMSGWIPPPSAAYVVDLLHAFTGGPLLLGLYVAVLGVGLGSAWLGLSQLAYPRLVVLGLWTVAPLALDYAFSLFVPSFVCRYVLYASLGLFLLTGWVLSRLEIAEVARWAVLVAILLPTAWGSYAHPILRPDWRRAAEIARRERADGVLTIVAPAYQLLPFSYHYAREAFADPTSIGPALRAYGVHALITLDGLAEAAPASKRIVIVSATGQSVVEIDALLARAHYRPVHGEHLTGIEVRVFESRS